MHDEIQVRPFCRNDIIELFEMMSQLATFEGYELQITPHDLERDGLGDRPTFGALVAENTRQQNLLGMAVHYTIPFTYHGRPNMVLKELYVREDYRKLGVGSKLFLTLCNLARKQGCKQLLWTVVPWNENAKKFYRRHGGSEETQWDTWLIPDLNL